MSGEQQGSAGHRRPLWAPWRIDYIRGPKDTTCFLCEKGRHEGPGDHVVYRGRTAYVLLNEFPYNSGHLLVAPYRHMADMDAMAADERNELMELLVRCTGTLKRVMQPQGFNIGFNLGEVAGAGLADHLHAHVVPRWCGDTNFMPVLADVRVVPEALEKTAEMVRSAWQ